MSANQPLTSSYISLKIQLLMEEIITIIKDMDMSSLRSDQSRLLYRSTDQLTELKCALLQLKVSQLSKAIA